MKRILISALFILGLFGFANAQQAPAATSATTAKTTTKKGSKATTAAVKSDKTVTKSTGLKKDGTPDMRMKANKDAAKNEVAAGPAKKNGTPDMRYKSNKKK